MTEPCDRTDLRQVRAANGIGNVLHIDHADRPNWWDVQLEVDDDEPPLCHRDLAEFVPAPIYAARAAN